MKKLTKQSNKNSPHSYDNIFLARRKKGINEFDLRRWKTLLKCYRGGNLIDLGCLDSLVSTLAYQRYPKAEIWGMDLAENAIWHMERQYPETNWEVGNLYSTRFPDNYFSYVVLGEVLEHLDEPQKAITEALRILKPGGVLATSTPLEEEIEPGAVDGERHIWSISEKDMRKMLGKVEVKILRSIKKPTYRYCWPQLIIWKKK